MLPRQARRQPPPLEFAGRAGPGGGRWHGAAGALGRSPPRLRCPVCAGRSWWATGQVSCARGHSFDIARQGYVSLTGGRAGPGTGDSAAMVMAREAFLGGGHYQPVADAVAGLAARLDPRRPRPGASTWPAAPATTSPACSTRSPARWGACVDLSAARAAPGRPGPSPGGGPRRRRLAAAAVRRRLGRAGAERLRAAQRGGDPPRARARRHADRRHPRPRPPPGAAPVARAIGIDERKAERLADAFGGYAARR